MLKLYVRDIVKLGLTVILFLVSCNNIFAQQDSTTFKPKINYKTGVSGMINSGNIERQLLRLNSSVECLLSPIFKFSSSPMWMYGQQNGNITEREYAFDVHTALFYQKKMYGIGFGEMEISRLRKIQHRYLGGLGAVYKIVDKSAVYISLSNAFVYEKTAFYSESDIKIFRNSSRLQAIYHIGKSHICTIKNSIYYQPSLLSNNYRWSAELSIDFPISKSLKLNTSLQNIYESLVKEGTKNNNFFFTIGVIWAK